MLTDKQVKNAKGRDKVYYLGDGENYGLRYTQRAGGTGKSDTASMISGTPTGLAPIRK